MSRLAARITWALTALIALNGTLAASSANAGQGGSGGGGSSNSSQNAGWMYSPTTVVDINLDIPQSSMDQISCDMGAPRPYVPATFTLTYTSNSRGKPKVTTYGPWSVSVHTKGWYGSFRCLSSGEKAGLKVKFKSPSQRIDGIKKLTLNNMAQDSSYAHEALTYQIFRSMNVASPRTGFARVSINGEYRGFYLNLETYDDVSLPLWFAGTTHLYEGAYGTWWGDLTDPFSNHYSVDEGSDTDRSDLQQLITTALNTSPGWYSRMAPIADLEQMTRMWATEWFVGHWDGYSQHLPNNYYLHRDGAGRFTMLPWGVDQTFGWAEPPHSGWDNFILNNCLVDPICASMYSDALRLVTNTVKNMNFTRQADAVYSVISSQGGWVSDSTSFIASRITDFEAWANTGPGQPRSISISTKTGTTKVSWKKPSNVTGITGYAVEYKSSTGSWARVTAAASATSITLLGMPPGTYEFRIRSIMGNLSRVWAYIAGAPWQSPETSSPIVKSGVRVP
jgi:hypothetical protein